MSIHNLMHVPAINDCPFCHKEGCVLNSHTAGENRANDNLYWISCDECDATGPSDLDRESAINYWNGPGEDITALRKDCDRLRRELDECNGVIR